MTNNPRDRYLRWLEPQLRDEHAPKKSFWELINIMFDKEFVWFVPHDDNRISDAFMLRYEFSDESGVPRDVMMSLNPCSFLEVHVVLSRKLAFTAGGDAPGWAWQLLYNLELQRMSDPLGSAKRKTIEDVLDTVIQRKYTPDGQGGFFPLAWSDDDQTQIELWYQLNAYVEEMHPKPHHP